MDRFRVLVAGGAGLVGAAVARQLLSEEASVVVADGFLDDGDGRAVREWRAEQLRGYRHAVISRTDLTEREAATALLSEVKPAAVVNAALFPGPHSGLPALLAACAALPEPPFVLHLSDAALYGAPAAPGQLAREEEALDPAGDLRREQRVVEEALVRGSGLPYTICRLVELLGPGFPPGRFPAGPYEQLLEGDEVVLPDDEPHDYLNLADAVTGLLAALARRPVAQTVNLGTGSGVRPSALLRLLAERSFRPLRLRVEGPPARARRLVDVQRARDLFRFTPRRTLEATAAEIVGFRLGASEVESTRKPGPARPVAPRPAPARDGPYAPERPEPLSRRDLFGIFRRPRERG